MQTIISAINGIELQKLTDTIEAVKNQPELGKFEFRLSNEWIGCGHNRSRIGQFYGAGQEDQTRDKPFIVDNDEPEVLLGQDLAPNPVEYVLHALAGCITTSLVYHAAARGYEIRKVRSSLSGELDLRGFLGLDPSVRNGYRSIRLELAVEGDFTDDEKAEIAKLGPTFSPVFDIVTNAVPVEFSLSV